MLKRLAWLQEYAAQRGRGSSAAPSQTPAVDGAAGTAGAAAAVLAALLGGQSGVPESHSEVAVSREAPAAASAVEPAEAAGKRKRRRRVPASSAWAAVDLEEEERQRKERRLQQLEEDGGVSSGDDVDGVPLAPLHSDRKWSSRFNCGGHSTLGQSALTPR